MNAKQGDKEADAVYERRRKARIRNRQEPRFVVSTNYARNVDTFADLPELVAQHANGPRNAAVWNDRERTRYPVKRGVVQDVDSRDPYTGKRTRWIAREIPADMLPEIHRVNAEIEAAEAQLNALMAERQEVLRAAAARGSKVRVDVKPAEDTDADDEA